MRVSDVWECPKCGCTAIEEIRGPKTRSFVISEIWEDGLCSFERDEGTWIDGYVCWECGYKVCDAIVADELFTFLKEGHDRLTQKGEAVTLSLSTAWKCPQCGQNQIEEIISDAMVTTPVVSVDKAEGPQSVGSPSAQPSAQPGVYGYGTPSVETGFVDHYQCTNCGHVIKEVWSLEALTQFLNSGGEES